MCNLSDAASYRKTGRRNGGTYSAIHREIDEVVKDLAKDLGPDAPIVIIAHSLGGHIMSNYIYDQQKRRQRTSVTSKPLREMGEHRLSRARDRRCSLDFADRKRALLLAAPAPQPNSEKERKLTRQAWSPPGATGRHGSRPVVGAKLRAPRKRGCRTPSCAQWRRDQ